MALFMWIDISDDKEFIDGGVVIGEDERDAYDNIQEQYGYDRSKDIITVVPIGEDQVHPGYYAQEGRRAYSMKEFLEDETSSWATGGETGNGGS